MSNLSSQLNGTAPGIRLSARARALLWLERYFPVVRGGGGHGPNSNSAHEFGKAEGSYAALLEELGGIADKTVLDFGCGWGGETAWLAQRSRMAVGCDVNTDALAEAQRFKNEMSLSNVEFVQSTNDRLPLESNRFDVVLSTNVFEHVMDVESMLREIHRVLRPGGAFLSTFGPLFYSPRGYHLGWATQVPYAHLFMGLQPILEVRNLRSQPLRVRTWRDTGLNMMTFRRFRRAALDAGFDPKRLRRVPVRRLELASRLPVIGELLTFGVDCHLIKPA